MIKLKEDAVKSAIYLILGEKLASADALLPGMGDTMTEKIIEACMNLNTEHIDKDFDIFLDSFILCITQTYVKIVKSMVSQLIKSNKEYKKNVIFIHPGADC